MIMDKEPTEEEILAQQIAHLDEEGDRIGDPLTPVQQPEGGA
jgi:hypothetical protein